MFGWLTRLFRRGRHRRIYRFWDGERDRLSDPLEVMRRLVEKGGPDWPKLLKNLELAKLSPAGLSPELATEQTAHVTAVLTDLIGLVRYAFEARPLSEGGLTNAECLDVLAAYLQWVAVVEAETRPTQSLPVSMGPQPSASSTTDASADSTSVEIMSDASTPMP